MKSKSGASLNNKFRASWISVNLKQNALAFRLQ